MRILKENVSHSDVDSRRTKCPPLSDGPNLSKATFALVDTDPSEGKEEKPFSFPCEDGDIFIPINPRPDSDVLRLELRARVTNPAWKEDHIVFLSIHLCFCPRLNKCLEPSKGPAVPLEVFFCPFRSTEKKKE